MLEVQGSRFVTSGVRIDTSPHGDVRSQPRRLRHGRPHFYNFSVLIVFFGARRTNATHRGGGADSVYTESLCR